MKKLTFLLGILALVAVIYSCTKDKTPSDPADIFVGNYNYSASYSGGLTFSGSGTSVITKTNANTISISIQPTGSNSADVRTFTVNGNNITEIAGQTSGVNTDVGVLQFAEMITGTLSGNIITMSGSWSYTGYQTVNLAYTLTKTK